MINYGDQSNDSGDALKRINIFSQLSMIINNVPVFLFKIENNSNL